MQPRLGIYRHYKGNLYRLVALATHSETLEDMIVYQQLYGDRSFWVRPASMWSEIVTVNGQQVERFAYIAEKEEDVR